MQASVSSEHTSLGFGEHWLAWSRMGETSTAQPTSRTTPRRDSRRVVIVGYDDAQILDPACPSGALEIANAYGAEPRYDIELATLSGRGVRGSSETVSGAARPLATVTFDTLVVAGGPGASCPTGARERPAVGDRRSPMRILDEDNALRLLNPEMPPGQHGVVTSSRR